MRDYGVLEQMGQEYQHCMDLVLARIMFVVEVGWLRRIADSRISFVSIDVGHRQSLQIEGVCSSNWTEV